MIPLSLTKKYRYEFIVDIPYVEFKIDDNILIKVLSSEDCDNVDKKHIKYYFFIFKIITWNVHNDLLIISQTFNMNSLRMEFDSDKYAKNLFSKKLIALYKKNKKLCKIEHDMESIEKIDKNIIDQVMTCVLNEIKKDDIIEEEEDLLRRNIHSYFTYWRKYYSKDLADQAYIRGKEAPMCPSIIREINLAEKFGWTLEYVRSLSLKDIKSLSIYEEQKEIAEFESNPENTVARFQNENNKMEVSLSINEALEQLYPNKNEKCMEENSIKEEEPESESETKTNKEKKENEKANNSELVKKEKSMIEEFLEKRNIKLKNS